MESQKTKNLRMEYESNIQLMNQDLQYRQHVSQTFLTMNTVFIVALGTLIGISQSLLSITIVVTLLSTLGFTTSFVWYQILIKNAEYMRFHRYQLRNIEFQLKNISTFKNQYLALDTYQKISLDGLDHDFEIIRSAKRSGLKTENNIPLILTGFWILTFLAAITLFLITLF